MATKNVKLPNGDIVTGVPDNVPDEAIIARYAKGAKPKEPEPTDPRRFMLDERDAIRARIDRGDTNVGQADLDVIERKLREAGGEIRPAPPPLTPEAVEAGAPPSTGPAPEVIQDDAARRDALLKRVEAEQAAAQPGMDRLLGQGLGAVAGTGVGGAMQTSQLARRAIDAMSRPPEAPRVEPTVGSPLNSGQKWLQNWAGHTDANPSVTSVPEAAALHNRQAVGHGKVSGRISKMYPQRPGQPNSIWDRMSPPVEPPSTPPMATPRTRAALDAVTNTFRTATQPFESASRIGTRVVPTLGVPIAGVGIGGGLADVATGVRQGDTERTALGGLEAAGSLASLFPRLARAGMPLTMMLEAYRALKDPADRQRLHEMMFGRTSPDKPI
jgi:hypothetical protein